jgi:hypothetical protein
VNRLYTLEGNNQTVGNPLLLRKMFGSKFKFPSLMAKPFALAVAPAKAIQKIVRKPINIPKVNIPRVSVPKVNIPRVNVPRITVPKFAVPKNLSIPKNPFSKTSNKPTFDDYQEMVDQYSQAEEQNYSPVTETEVSLPANEFNQNDIQMEMDSTPIYASDVDQMMGALKFGKNLTFGKKKKNLIQKLLLIKPKSKIAKLTPTEIKKGLVVTAGIVSAVASGGATAPLVASGLITAGTAATATAYAGAAVAAVSGLATAASPYIATGSVISTALAKGGSSSSLLNAGLSLASNPTITDNFPLAKSANSAISTGLGYYNTGAGIAEGFGLSVPSLGNTSSDLLKSVLTNKPTASNRALVNQYPSPTPTIFKDPVNDPSHPLYQKPSGVTTGKPIQQQTQQTESKEGINSNNLFMILGLGALGYFVMNSQKKGKKK